MEQLSLFQDEWQKGDTVKFCGREHLIRKIYLLDGINYYECVDEKWGGIYTLTAKRLPKKKE